MRTVAAIRPSTGGRVAGLTLDSEELPVHFYRRVIKVDADQATPSLADPTLAAHPGPDDLTSRRCGSPSVGPASTARPHDQSARSKNGSNGESVG
jgi:hypothetical protein